MVVISTHRCFTSFGCVFSFRGRLCGGSIHLFFILMNREKKLESVLIISAGFLVLFFVFKIKIFIFISLLILLLSAMSDLFTDGLTWLWFKLAEVLGWINSRILLGLIFFLFLFPVALIARLLNKTSISFKKNKDTYYSERNHTYTPEDIENMW